MTPDDAKTLIEAVRGCIEEETYFLAQLNAAFPDLPWAELWYGRCRQCHTGIGSYLDGYCRDCWEILRASQPSHPPAAMDEIARVTQACLMPGLAEDFFKSDPLLQVLKRRR